MPQFLQQAMIQLQRERYLRLILIVAPILNFLSGLTITLYTASLPAIATYFDSSMMVVKNIVTCSMIGFAVGCLVFGTALDTFGRRLVILFALGLYIVVSLLALVASNVHEIIAICFIQSMMSASVSIGPRALISDHFNDHRFQIGMLYTSLAYGLGSIIGPFIGGVLQYHYGWKSIFVSYSLAASILLVVFIAYINESLVNKTRFLFKQVLAQHFSMFMKWGFLAGAIISAACQFELMVYSAIGAFMIENVLHRTALAYGNSALMVSLGYLLGTLLNRALIKYVSLYRRTCLGFALLALGLILQFAFAMMGSLNLITLVVPISLIAFSNGFIFMNVFSPSVKMFPNNAGVAMAVFTCLTMFIAGLGLFIISQIDVKNLWILALFFSVPIAIQFLVYFSGFQRHSQ